MNQNFYKRINKLAAEKQYDLENIPEGVLISVRDEERYEEMKRSISRMKNIHSETHFLTLSARVYDRDDYKKLQESRVKTTNLADKFFEVYKETGSQSEAKAAEYEYAVQIGAVEEFNKIYAGA